jgi:hypothetical protein
VRAFWTAASEANHSLAVGQHGYAYSPVSVRAFSDLCPERQRACIMQPSAHYGARTSLSDPLDSVFMGEDVLPGPCIVEETAEYRVDCSEYHVDCRRHGLSTGDWEYGALRGQSTVPRLPGPDSTTEDRYNIRSTCTIYIQYTVLQYTSYPVHILYLCTCHCSLQPRDSSVGHTVQFTPCNNYIHCALCT